MISSEDSKQFAVRALTAAGLLVTVVALIYFLTLLTDVLLLTFAGALLAVGIDGMTRVVQRVLPGPRMLALGVALLLMLLAAALAAWFIVPQAAAQIPMLIEQLPQALRQLIDLARSVPGLEAVLREGASAEGFLGDGTMLARVGGVFSTAFGAIGSLVLILVIGLYLAISPTQYAEHLVRLFPRERRPRIAAMLVTQGRALRLWLLSRLISMVFVGVATAVALMLIGVPMAFTLGLLSGLLTFIPYLGPILAAIPTALVALLVEPRLALLALLLYTAVEAIESNVVSPLAAKGVMHLPPAYTVVIQIAGGVIAGLPGVILATPLAVAAAVVIQMLYIEDTLGDEVEVLGGEAEDGESLAA